jgi:hypothetical protein
MENHLLPNDNKAARWKIDFTASDRNSMRSTITFRGKTEIRDAPFFVLCAAFFVSAARRKFG